MSDPSFQKKRKCDQICTDGNATNQKIKKINITGGENIIRLPNNDNYELNISGGKNNITFFQIILLFLQIIYTCHPLSPL